MARRLLYSRCPLSPSSLLVMENATGTTATDGSSCLLGVVVSRKNRRVLGTTSSAAFGPEKWREQGGEGGGGGAGAGAGRYATNLISPTTAPFSSVNNYKLPLPSWSLADLTLGVGAQTDAAPVLGREEVRYALFESSASYYCTVLYCDALYCTVLSRQSISVELQDTDCQLSTLATLVPYCFCCSKV